LHIRNYLRVVINKKEITEMRNIVKIIYIYIYTYIKIHIHLYMYPYMELFKKFLNETSDQLKKFLDKRKRKYSVSRKQNQITYK